MLVRAQDAASTRHCLSNKTRLESQLQANKLGEEINLLTGVEKAS